MNLFFLHRFCLFALLLLAALGIAQAQQPGDIDQSFHHGQGHAFLQENGVGTGANNTIGVLAVQPDNKVLIGGLFTYYNGMIRNRIARLNADGSLDVNFNPTGSGANDEVSAVIVQSDGKVLIGGKFTSYNGTARNRITRLNADGSLDVNFNPTGSGANDEISAVIVQSDGKVLIGGRFTSYNGTARNRIARLNSDGSLDVNFNPIGSGANDEISALALQAGGKVVIGGEFTSYNGTSRSRIARLNADGSLDTGFNPGTGPDDAVFALALQPDGKVLIGGALTSFSGVTRNKIARLNVDGSLDTGFAPDTGANEDILSLILLSDGKVLIGGVFWAYDGISRNGVARLNANGSLDNAVFTPTGTGLNDQINALALQPDGPVVKVLIGGDFTTHNESGRNRIARLSSYGSLDFTFSPGKGVVRGWLNCLALQSDGKVLLGGYFTLYNDSARRCIARLNANGSLDSEFDPGTAIDEFPGGGYISTIALQPDGKALIGGNFRSYNGIFRTHVARLNADGSLDVSFDWDGPNYELRALAVQPDGKVLIGGDFVPEYNKPYFRIARLNADGSRDVTFNPGTGADGSVNAIVVQSDGKVLIGGQFISYNGVSRNGIARFHADGSLDASFNPGTGTTNGPYGGSVKTIALQPDGKVLIGGGFSSYNGTARNRIARLNADGSLDAGFNPGTGANSSINTLVLQSDGKVLIGGDFTTYNGTARNYIARLNADGTLDESFNPGVGMNGLVRALVLQPDGKVLIGGDFTSYNGSPRAYVARVLGDATTARTASLAAGGIQLYPNPTQGQLTVAIATPGSYSLQLSDLQGRVVYTTTLSSSAGGTTTSLQLPSLAPGLYSVQVAGASGTYSGKLSVQ